MNAPPASPIEAQLRIAAHTQNSLVLKHQQRVMLRWRPSMKAVALRYLISKRRVTKQLKRMANSSASSKPTPGYTYFALRIKRNCSPGFRPWLIKNQMHFERLIKPALRA
jgi:hypothetical protein